eukprot:104108-Pyramimonas_sp.AAC.1
MFPTACVLIANLNLQFEVASSKTKLTKRVSLTGTVQLSFDSTVTVPLTWAGDVPSCTLDELSL